VSRGLIASVAIVTAGFFAFAIGAAVRAQRRKPTTGLEGLIGAIAEVRSDLDPEGIVFLQGERWKARMEEGDSMKSGEMVRVLAVDGFELIVAPAESPETASTREMSDQTAQTV